MIPRTELNCVVCAVDLTNMHELNLKNPISIRL